MEKLSGIFRNCFYFQKVVPLNLFLYQTNKVINTFSILTNQNRISTRTILNPIYVSTYPTLTINNKIKNKNNCLYVSKRFFAEETKNIKNNLGKNKNRKMSMDGKLREGGASGSGIRPTASHLRKVAQCKYKIFISKQIDEK